MKKTVHYFFGALLILCAIFNITCSTCSTDENPCIKNHLNHNVDLIYVRTGQDCRGCENTIVNKEVFNWLYTKGDSHPYLTEDHQGVQGVAFRIKCDDKSENYGYWAGRYISIDIILTYEFPGIEPPCQGAILHWELNPSLWLPHGAQITIPDADAVDYFPQIGIFLNIVEDPEGMLQPSMLNTSDANCKEIDHMAITESIGQTSVFIGKHEGSFVINPGFRSKLHVWLRLQLTSPEPGYSACIGCNLTDLEIDNLLESAIFSVGIGNQKGPYWYTTPSESGD